MHHLLLTCLLSASCPPGEYGLDPPNCTSCWPCEPGSRCVNGSRRACETGTWAGRGEAECRKCDAACEPGRLRVHECNPTGGLVCAPCPAGFGCDGEAALCAAGTHSLEGICAACPANRSSDAGASECVCLTPDCTACPPDTIAFGTRCRSSPKGYGLVSGELRRCPRDTYSSPSGHCLPCSANAWSEPGAASADECVCADGYTRSGGECVACKAGTVHDNRQCALCPPGEYCLGKTHHEPCPADMYSHRGAGMCTPCRLNSGCLKRCVSELNCTCDIGYVDMLGECRRCAAATMEVDKARCVRCPRGYECKGGAEVTPCALATWSPGNRSACLPCTKCPELTASRCNSTHNSVCEPTTVPLGVLSVFQQYTVPVDGGTFATFAQLYAASIPRAQLLRVCDKDECAQCFQGLCPERMQRLYGPGFELAFEVRGLSSRIGESLEALNRPTYLSELAKTTMAKLTDKEFLFFSRIEHSTLCPAWLRWEDNACRERTSKQRRSWAGLGASILFLLSLTILGWNGRKWMGGGAAAETEEEQNLVVSDERTTWLN